MTFDKFARISALRPTTKRARLASASPAPAEGESLLSSLLGGACDRTHFGQHFVLRRWYAHPEPCPPLNGALQLLDPRAPRLAADPARWLFLDTETTGLAGGTGTYAFLVGLAWWDSAGLQVEQFFLRDYDDEHSMLTALAARLAERPVLVTFNGKSFDWPLLETRYRMTRSIHVPEPVAHLDLLHPARHIWRLRLGSVRLSELERSVLGAPSSIFDWDRRDDIPSMLIPQTYFDYLRGIPTATVTLAQVFRHNQMDLRGLAAIAVKLASLLDAPESADAAPLDLYGLSRLLHHRAQHSSRARPATRGRRPLPVGAAPRGRPRKPRDEAVGADLRVRPPMTALTRAQHLCDRALASGLPAGLDRAALRDLAALAKRQRDFPRACSLWEQLADVGAGPSARPGKSNGVSPMGQAPGPAPTLDAIEAFEQLAIHYEHRARDPHRALHFARLALDALRPATRTGLLTPAKSARLRALLDRRITRLQRKSGSDASPRPSGNSASPRFLLTSADPASGIARTPLRRASKRPLPESNGHAQS